MALKYSTSHHPPRRKTFCAKVRTSKDSQHLINIPVPVLCTCIYFHVITQYVHQIIIQSIFLEGEKTLTVISVEKWTKPKIELLLKKGKLKKLFLPH